MDSDSPIHRETQQFAFMLVLNNLTLPDFLRLPMERQVSLSVRAGLNLGTATAAVEQLNLLIRVKIAQELKTTHGAGEQGAN